MKLPALLFGRPLSCALAVALLLPALLSAAERGLPPVVGSVAGSGFVPEERDALVSWTMAQPAVQAAVGRHRTRTLRVWLDADKEEGGSRPRAIVLIRDYDTGSAREISVDLWPAGLKCASSSVSSRTRKEIDEGMGIVRRDSALARFVGNPSLRLIGGFHSRSAVRNDPCAVEVCLDFAFMKPDYQGPARYVVVNLTRGIVAHHDFRGGRPGGPPARMTETTDR